MTKNIWTIRFSSSTKDGWNRNTHSWIRRERCQITFNCCRYTGIRWWNEFNWMVYRYDWLHCSLLIVFYDLVGSQFLILLINNFWNTIKPKRVSVSNENTFKTNVCTVVYISFHQASVGKIFPFSKYFFDLLLLSIKTKDYDLSIEIFFIIFNTKLTLYPSLPKQTPYSKVNWSH